MTWLTRLSRWIFVVISVVVSGCAVLAPPTPTPELVPTDTPAPPDPATPTPDVQPTDTPVASPTPTPDVEPTPTPDLIGYRVEGGELGEIWDLADIRYRHEANRFRLMLEMEETHPTAPYYTAELTDEDTEPFPVDRDPAWGTVRIDLVVSDLYAWDYPLGEELPVEVAESPLVNAITLFPTFDDALLGFSIWLESPARFRIQELSDPVRLSVEVIYP